jgi:hypothetical protein
MAKMSFQFWGIIAVPGGVTAFFDGSLAEGASSDR